MQTHAVILTQEITIARRGVVFVEIADDEDYDAACQRALDRAIQFRDVALCETVIARSPYEAMVDLSHHAKDLIVLLESLRKDPTLNTAETGRRLLDMLDAMEITEEEMNRFLQGKP